MPPKTAKKQEAEQEQNLNLFIYFVAVPILTVISGVLHRIDIRPFFLLAVFTFVVFVIGIPLFNKRFLTYGIIFTAAIIVGGIFLDAAVLPTGLFGETPKSRQKQQQEFIPQEYETEQEREALSFLDLPGVTFVSEKMQEKIGMSIHKLSSSYVAENYDINHVERWIDINSTHLVVAALKEPTVTGEDARVYYFPAFFLNEDDNKGHLIIGPNNRRFEKFVQLKDNKYSINGYTSAPEQGLTEAYFFLREAVNTAEREFPELAPKKEEEAEEIVEEANESGSSNEQEIDIEAEEKKQPAAATAAPATTTAPATSAAPKTEEKKN